MELQILIWNRLQEISKIAYWKKIYLAIENHAKIVQFYTKPNPFVLSGLSDMFHL